MRHTCSMQFLHPVFELQMSLMGSLKVSDPQGDLEGGYDLSLEFQVFLLMFSFGVSPWWWP